MLLFLRAWRDLGLTRSKSDPILKQRTDEGGIVVNRRPRRALGWDWRGRGRETGGEEGVVGTGRRGVGANNGFQPFQYGMVTSNDGGTLPLPLAETDFDTKFMVQ